jgi:hypothetical protein
MSYLYFPTVQLTEAEMLLYAESWRRSTEGNEPDTRENGIRIIESIAAEVEPCVSKRKKIVDRVVAYIDELHFIQTHGTRP